MVEFLIDVNAPDSPFPHYWEMCVGSCHAVMGLRADWQAQLAKSHRELGFEYVRFHGLFDDDMNVVMGAENGVRYSFHSIDLIYDFLLSIGMKPFIEMGFMPSVLASGDTTCFYYRGNVTPPKDYSAWEDLVRTFTQHLVDRYGIDEVRTWFFEVWNEPNLSYFWAGTQEEYFKLYEHAARAVKSVDSQLKVGGPATSCNSWLPETLEFVRANNVPLDFLSTHHYPTDDPLWRHDDMPMEERFQRFGHELGKVYERGVLQKMTAKARDQAGDLPLYYTEWNTSAMIPDHLHDESYAAALVAKTIVDNDGLVQGYSFWTFSDLFEEPGQYATPFHGGFGLQNIDGIPKPTYRLFEMLHQMEDRRLPVEGGSATVEAVATRGDNSLTVLVYNHNIPAGEIADETVTIRLKGVPAGAQATITRIDETSANPKAAWIAMGSPEYPTRAQLSALEEASRPVRETVTLNGDALTLTIPKHGVAEIKIAL